jgi:hypothetical protein
MTNLEELSKHLKENFKRLKDLTISHVYAILETQRLPKEVADIFLRELDYRYNHIIKNE